jgi:hypothetical protein
MPDEQDAPISHLQRRKIEARMLIPLIQACRETFGEAAARELVTTTIRRLATTRWWSESTRGRAGANANPDARCLALRLPIPQQTAGGTVTPRSSVRTRHAVTRALQADWFAA